MRFYEVISSGYYERDSQYFATKKEAMAEARREVAADCLASVDLVEIAVNKQSIIGLANQEGWCRNRKRIWEKNGNDD